MSAPTEGGPSPVPKTDFEGEPVVRFDFPSFRVGVAEYEEGPTGCTVFHFPGGASAAIDVRGGLVGKTGDYEFNHAICLAGGSLPGVTAELWDRGGRSLENLPLVSGAIIFDYGGRENRVYPDKALGRAALSAARGGVFPLGARGVGRRATCGGVLGWDRGEPSGQGGAFREAGPTKVAVFCVSMPSGPSWVATAGSRGATETQGPASASTPPKACCAGWRRDSQPPRPGVPPGATPPSP